MARTLKEKVNEWVDNWRVVAEESDRLKAIELEAMTEAEAARQFNGLDCDPSLIWTPEERIFSSGLVEQQRIFGRAYGLASRIHGGA